MKRRFRLTRSTDFKRVRRLGKSHAHPLIVLIALANDQEQTRLGVAAGRSVGNAVQRNRAKRLMRAALQPLLVSIQPGWDIILLARRPMAEADFQQTQVSLSSLLQRARLLVHTHED